MASAVRVSWLPRSVTVSANRTVRGVSAATLSHTTRANPTASGASSGRCMSAIVGSRAAAASTSGAAIDNASNTPPDPNVSRSSCALRATSELSWNASPITNRIVEGYRNRTCSAVRIAMASATASSRGIDAAQTWSTVATSLSPRNGSITINHTPTPTAMLTIVASMPLRSSLAVVPWPSIVAVATSRPAAMRRKGSATGENVSRDVK